MRALLFALAVAIALVASAARAHGPQIQITRNDNKITTRRLFREEPYTTKLTPPTAVYVIPLLETGGVWYSRPNNQPSATLPGVPEYLSGPGIAYGYDKVDGSLQAFASGYRFELKLIDRLQWWNGLAYQDPGSEEIEAFRASGSPAITNDSLTPASPATLAYSNLPANYDANAHSGASFRLLGDGTSPTTASDDGVYLLTMSYSNTEPGLSASDPFFFVLHKNATAAEVHAAVNSLGFAPSLVEYIPEPGSAVLLAVGAAFLAINRRVKCVQRRPSR